MVRSFISLSSLEYMGVEGLIRVREITRGVYFSEREYGGIFSVEYTAEPESKFPESGMRGVAGE